MFYEKQHLGTVDHFVREYGENFSFPPHMHLCFELITVTVGEMQVTVDGKSYTLSQGQALLIFPHQLHSLSSQSSRHMLCIFSPDLVRAYFAQTKDLLPQSNCFSLSAHLREQLQAISNDASQVAKKGLLYSLCADFDAGAEYLPRLSSQKDLLARIFSFVEEHYREECTLERLASMIGYDYAYLSRYFKRATGITYVQYLTMFRLNQACYRLDNTNDSILQCAMESGFSSLRSFNRNFKKQFEVPPAIYRKRNHGRTADGRSS